MEAPDTNLAHTHSRPSFLHRRHHSHEISKGSITVDKARDSAVSKEKKGTGKMDDPDKSEDTVDEPSEQGT